MNLIQVNDVSKTYGENELFHRITFGVDQGQKIALIARNGAGKSTLLNILTKKDIPDEGTVTHHKDLKIGFLQQNPHLDESKTIAEVLYDSDTPLIQTINHYQKALRLVDSDNNPENQSFLQKMMEEMDAREAWDYDNQIREVLSKFNIHDLNQKVGALSGGEKKKVALAQVLIQDANLLILDEPTNHLDINMIEWLEKHLARQKLAILLVTHDRYFLDNVCDEILELDYDRVHHYKGNFDYFLEKRKERIEQEAVEIEKAQNLYRRELEWIRRGPKARTSKSKKRIENFEKIKEKASQKVEDESQSDFKVNMSRLGKKILEIRTVTKAFENKPIVDRFTYTFKRGEHIGIIGPNGIGKTTLLKIITGDMKPDSGEVVKGPTVTFGYYSQEGMKPKPNERLIDIASEIASIVHFGDQSMSISQFLSHFNFDHSTQYNHFENLSGGERRRFHLITTLLKNPNFLILDEPTNDLDVYTLNVLENFLDDYNGCVLIVTHDRRFLDALADHVFAFEGEGVIKDFPGNYSQYEEWKKKKEAEKRSREKQVKQQSHKQEKQKKKPQKKFTYKEKKEYEELSEEIESLEQKKAELLEKMNSETDNQTLTDISKEFKDTSQKLEEKEERWLELSEKIEE